MIYSSPVTIEELKIISEIKTEEDIQKDISKTCRIQNKGSRFFVLDSDGYIEKTDHQLEKKFFQQLHYNPSNEFHKNVTPWIKKWKQNKALDHSWCRVIETSYVSLGKAYGLIKTPKVGNPVKVITSGCGVAIKNLSISVEKCFCSEVLNIRSSVKDTSEMLTTIDNLNKSNTLLVG